MFHCAVLLYLVGALACKASLDVSGLPLPHVTASGYLDVRKRDGSKLFFSFYESEAVATEETPILLWLQGGPGCASHFGNFYELGPARVNGSESLSPNPGAWNRNAGVLFLDQPVGTGFSIAGSGRIPRDEMEIATDVYLALQDFFERNEDLQHRPFILSGESYAGKYIPSIGHYIHMMERVYDMRDERPEHPAHRTISAVASSFGAPKFRLQGLAIGNGLTDPGMQVQTHASTAFYQGLIDTQQRVSAMAMQLRVSQAIAAGDWAGAHSLRQALLDFLQDATGVGTLFDGRRTYEYDSEHLVDKYLNHPDVKAHLGAEASIEFVSCSAEVAAALGPDVMKSAKHLLPDLLDAYPLLLYQGAFDLQDGPATSEAWIHSLQWPGREAFAASRRTIWRSNPNGTVPHYDPEQVHSEARVGSKGLGRVVGYWRHWGPLTQVVLKHSGHMVPRDDSLAAQAMIESWLRHAVHRDRRVARAPVEEAEEMFSQ